MPSHKNLILEEIYHLLPTPTSPEYIEAWEKYKALLSISNQKSEQKLQEKIRGESNINKLKTTPLSLDKSPKQAAPGNKKKQRQFGLLARKPDH